MRDALRFENTALLVTDLNDKIIHVNQAWERLFGYERMGVFDKQLSDILPLSRETERDGRDTIFIARDSCGHEMRVRSRLVRIYLDDRQWQEDSGFWMGRSMTKVDDRLQSLPADLGMTV